MVSIQKVDNAIRFTFENSSFYLYNDGTVNVPLNALTLVLDEADMANFVKASSNDNLFSIPMSELSQFADKAALQSWFEENAYGGSGGITPEEVAEMIDEAVAPVEDDIETIADDINEKEEVVARALTDLHENKLDVSAYTPTDLSQYWTSAQTEAAISTATSGKQDTLTAGSGISINNDVISVTVDPTLDSGSTNPVANSAITQAIDAKQDLLSHYTEDYNEAKITFEADGLTTGETTFQAGGFDTYGTFEDGDDKYEASLNISDRTVSLYYAHLSGETTLESGNLDFSSDANGLSVDVGDENDTTLFKVQPSGATINDDAIVTDSRLDGLSFVRCTQAEYDALVQGGTVDADTLYVITNVV